ncbi:Ig-like domain-containing protein [Maribacter halichondriae]|uniref:Ig-like domain-containing protein n=1 Tax=Maribacter halichondriae TaxID=2980554 RepID=UPI0023599A7C|nr:Ig-like domain-containing protein [Maribacter sp. Hal144]
MEQKKSGFLVLCIVIFSIASCSKNETGSDIVTEISSISLMSDQIVDEKINISASFAKEDVPGSSVEVFVDSQSIYQATEQANISFSVDPLDYATGTHSLKVVFTKMDGKSTEKEVQFSVQRKLITINLPQNMINQ